jgi:hypothetical protein
MARFRKSTISAIVMTVAYSSRRSTPPTYMGRRRKRWTTTPSRNTDAIASGRARYQRSQPSTEARRKYCT